jgi:hypothetical protein
MVALEEGNSGDVSAVGAATGAGEGADEAGLSEGDLKANFFLPGF